MDIAVLRDFSEGDRIGEWKSLLAIRPGEELAAFESVEREEVSRNTKTRVINQDVLRTRADEVFFRSSVVQMVLRHSLTRFCSYYRIEYMQGLNEILAPVLALDPGIVDQVERMKHDKSDSSTVEATTEEYDMFSHPFQAHLLVFERLMGKLSPTTFSTRGVDAIQVQLTAFHLLLTYHEPVLALILRKAGMTPDIYAMSWLITLFARRQPVHRALHIWDMVLQINTPQIWVFLAVALVRSRKRAIFSLSADTLPATLVGLKFESDDEVDAVFAAALQLLRSTPSHITEELAVLGFSRDITEMQREKGLKDLWHRPCIGVSATEVAQSLAFGGRSTHDSSEPSATSPAPARNVAALRYLVLDCRRSVEQQQHDALYIEGSVSIPFTVQEEICALARQKSLLFDRDEVDPSAGGDAHTIERSFAKLIGQLGTRAATVLTLLWTAFVTHSSQEVHFAVADDSVGPFQCSDIDRSPLNTSYALPYHTVSSKDNRPQLERATNDSSRNLPQYLTNAAVQASNAATVSFASALIILGFPRVAIVQPEDLQRIRGQSSDAAQFACTDSNSFSSLPVMSSEMRSSSFACLVHHLGICGVAPAVINARFSHLQTPIDHFKEYQVCAFIHELRGAPITYGTITHDYYTAPGDTLQRNADRHSRQDLHSSAGTSPQRPSQVTGSSIVATVLSLSVAKPTGRAIDSRPSTSTLSSLSMALNAFSPTSTPRATPRTPGAPTAGAGGVGEGISPREYGHVSNSGGSAMKAKVACTLDVLYNLLLIMSAQKKQHIVRLVATVFFHSCVPAMRAGSPAHHTPFAGVDEEEDGQEKARRAARDYSFMLGPPPPADAVMDNSEYYRQLEALLNLRDTLQELKNTQRLNTALDKTANKASTKIRLLKSAIDQSARQSSRAIASLSTKTTLRSTQQRQREAAAGTENGQAEGGVNGESGAWKTTKDLHGYFHGEDDEAARTDSRSNSALRDSSVSLSADHNYSDQQARGRVYSSDSVGLHAPDIL